ncbi:Beta-glucosidase-like SFR2, chloroplastic [Artemisia annua]|uniref:Beta-glucosidase-like SFR2, chloroplastic n=1 Tax=Artemisia annua TaxID=35608 RepID=A0A2U1N349_ARTAN|nr:Beta-glucosidase-like SFR2, chloroplastic [Artemisia annua]
MVLFTKLGLVLILFYKWVFHINDKIDPPRSNGSDDLFYIFRFAPVALMIYFTYVLPLYLLRTKLKHIVHENTTPKSKCVLELLPFHMQDVTILLNQNNYAALERYRWIISRVQSYGMKIMLTLFHHSLPPWAGEYGGWRLEKTINYFMDFTRLVNVGKPVNKILSLEIRGPLSFHHIHFNMSGRDPQNNPINDECQNVQMAPFMLDLEKPAYANENGLGTGVARYLYDVLMPGYRKSGSPSLDFNMPKQFILFDFEAAGSELTNPEDSTCPDEDSYVRDKKKARKFTFDSDDSD